ncbi:MAG: glycosyltransferase [Candidatus Pacebacteria bacterium]|nr:glycosyltransferase [Candidatus Paceibacterota bacterium]
MKPANLTAIILCHQLDPLLRQAIESVRFCDQIILVDNSWGSKQISWSWLKNWTNPTQPIIVRWSDKINDFSRVRNWAIKQAKHDWILMIDSDEQLADPQKAKLILTQIASQQTKPAAYYLLRQDYYLKRPLSYGEAGQQNLIRFFHRQAGQFQRPVHEIFKPKTKVQTQQLSLKIIHQAHPDLNQFLQAVNRYARLEAANRSSSNQLKIIFQLLLFPIAKFGVSYFFKLGLLDGWSGLSYASMMSLHSALVRIYQLENLTQNRGEA